MRSRLTRWAIWFQSTHPRGVRLPLLLEPVVPDRVSIHAPAWGATLADLAEAQGISKFQSTHPRGVRRQRLVPARHFPDVSIHAPAWGATRWQRWWPPEYFGFNPRTRVGCDGALRSRLTRWARWFQSTHPRGVRLSSDTLFIIVEIGFNPRTRVGCDLENPNHIGGSSCFNPRTRVGCDARTGRHGWPGQSFNPRTRVGCDTINCSGGDPRYVVSIHAPAWGATPRSYIIANALNAVSIHAPAWGATPVTSPSTLSRAWFQSTHPRGVRRA